MADPEGCKHEPPEPVELDENDPFAEFDEWSSKRDEDAYARLSDLSATPGSATERRLRRQPQP